MKYETIIPLTKDEALPHLESADAEEVVYGLLGAVDGEDDWCWLQAQCLALLTDKRFAVARVAVMCLGHIARIHGRLDLSVVMPALKAAQKDRPDLEPVAQDAISDMNIFLEKTASH